MIIEEHVYLYDPFRNIIILGPDVYMSINEFLRFWYDAIKVCFSPRERIVRVYYKKARKEGEK